jgi:predicted RNA-binding Zn-ribbon protein involved in translation (DUF1610 family)
MKIEESQEFGHSIYMLTDKEVAALIEDSELIVSESSPLKKLDKSFLARTLPKEAAELADAMKILTTPDLFFSIRTWPDGGDWIEYYGADDNPNLVMLSRNEQEGANLMIWPIAQAIVKSMVVAPLMSSMTHPEDKISFDLSFPELLLLASLVDRQQEIVLQNFIDRKFSTEVHFTDEDIQTTYKKGRHGKDLRWMVTRLAHVFLTGLPDELDGVANLLEKFSTRRLIVNDANGYAVLPSGDLVLRQLADIEGLSSLVTKRRVNDNSADDWEEHHAVYQANRWQIWFFDVSTASQPSLRNKLETISLETITSSLDDLFRIPLKSSAKETATKEKACSSCNAQLQPKQKYCPECGAPVIAPKSKEKPKKEVQPKCSNCGKRLKNGLKFCTECGRKI